jgi:hypothetical protein
VQPGQSFFVPALDVEEVRRKGLIAALPYRFNRRPAAEVGILNGRLGVLFSRPSEFLLRTLKNY